VIARAFSESIGVITIGVDLRSSEVAVSLAKRHHTIWAAVGVHPHDAKTLDQSVLSRLETLAKAPKVVAIGEIGLDYYRDLSPRAVQRRAFEAQIELARKSKLPFLALGFYLGIGGPVTFNKNRILQEAVKEIPLERIILETDCPYLTPVPYRGKRNEPAYVRYVAEKVAELKGISVEKVKERTTNNAVSLFAL
jgi:TatD DNase family protein